MLCTLHTMCCALLSLIRKVYTVRKAIEEQRDAMLLPSLSVDALLGYLLSCTPQMYPTPDWTEDAQTDGPQILTLIYPYTVGSNRNVLLHSKILALIYPCTSCNPPCPVPLTAHCQPFLSNRPDGERVRLASAAAMKELLLKWMLLLHHGKAVLPLPLLT